MKKRFASLLLLSLLLLLSACGAQQPATDKGQGSPDSSAPATEETALHFALGEPLLFEEEYTADDGATLLTVSFELPQLELRTESGARYELPTTANTADTQPREVAVRDKFNTEMARELESRKALTAEILDMAREHYESVDADYLPYWGGYLESLSIDEVYLTDGLVSVRGTGDSYYGGAHPMGGAFTRSFDLTSGEFLTLDYLDFAPSDMTALGETLTHTLALYILDEIDAEGLASEYYEDYYSYIFDLAANANFCFTEAGMTVLFDPYVIAPYAAGPQEFTVPYEVFYNALDAHTQSLLEVSRDALVLADYRYAETLWSWFYLTGAPIDTGAPVATVDDDVYARVSCGDLDSLESLRALLCTRLSAEVADEWLGTGRFIEVNGGLYTLFADNVIGTELGGEAFAVEWTDATSGTLTQTLNVQHFDEASGSFVLTGETETFESPFTLTDGHAVFSAFPCPW